MPQFYHIPEACVQFIPSYCELQLLNTTSVTPDPWAQTGPLCRTPLLLLTSSPHYLTGGGVGCW